MLVSACTCAYVGPSAPGDAGQGDTGELGRLSWAAPRGGLVHRWPIGGHQRDKSREHGVRPQRIDHCPSRFDGAGALGGGMQCDGETHEVLVFPPTRGGRRVEDEGQCPPLAWAALEDHLPTRGGRCDGVQAGWSMGERGQIADRRSVR